MTSDMELTVDIPAILADLMKVAPAGFAIGLHIRFTTPVFLFQTYPREWVEEYSRDGLVARDPTVAWVFMNEGHVTWEELTSQDEAGVLERAAAYGLRHGLTVSVAGNGTRSLGGFARSDRPFTPDETERIEAAMKTLHATTDATQPLPESIRDSLRRLSIAVTHP